MKLNKNNSIITSVQKEFERDKRPIKFKKDKTKQLIEEILEEGASKVEITPTEVSVFMYAPNNHAHFNWQHCELEVVLKDVLKWVKEAVDET